MKKYLVIFILTGINLLSMHAQNKLQYMSFDSLYNRVSSSNNLVILNFWATWCKPCVAELPEFEKIHDEFTSKGAEVILANMDMHSKVEPAVPDFMVRNNLRSGVIHITNTDPNDFINRVDPSWSGALPATVIYYKGKKIKFHEGQITYEELKSILIKYIQQ